MKRILAVVLFLVVLPIGSTAAATRAPEVKVKVGPGRAFAGISFDREAKRYRVVAVAESAPRVRSDVRTRAESGTAVAGQVINVRGGHVSIVAVNRCHNCDVKTGDAD